jgi:hypothetical protein
LRLAASLTAIVALRLVGVAMAAEMTAVETRAAAGVHLSWVRDETSASCPDAAAIETEVSARLGDDPFKRAPSQFIEAIVIRQAETFQVTIAMRGPEGKLIGNRSLASASSDCRSIATAAALTITILIDPDALARPAPAPVAKAEPTASAAAAPIAAAREPSGPSGRVGALAAGGWGLLPGLSPGVGLAVTIDLGRRFAASAVIASFPERRASAPNQGFAFGVSYAEVLGCVVALGAGDPGGIRAELCGGVAAGALHVVVSAPNPVDPGQRWHLAAAQVTRLIIPVLRDGFVEAGVEITAPLTRRAFFVEGRAAGMDTVFTQAAVGLAGFAGAGLRWR